LICCSGRSLSGIDTLTWPDRLSPRRCPFCRSVKVIRLLEIMNEADKTTIRKNTVVLVEKMELAAVLDYLFQLGTITRAQHEELMPVSFSKSLLSSDERMRLLPRGERREERGERAKRLLCPFCLTRSLCLQYVCNVLCPLLVTRLAMAIANQFNCPCYGTLHADVKRSSAWLFPFCNSPGHFIGLPMFHSFSVYFCAYLVV